MKRFLSILFLALVVPGAAIAGDIENPDECKAHGDGVFVQQVPLNSDDEAQRDRGSACVNAGGTQVVYVGGELQGEDEWHENGPCGAVVVLDDEVTEDGEKDFSHEDCD